MLQTPKRFKNIRIRYNWYTLVRGNHQKIQVHTCFEQGRSNSPSSSMPTGGSSAPLELLVVGRDAIEAAERQLRSRTSHKRASENDVLHNRIRTIFYDSAFVESVATLYKRSPNNIPLFANLRCGLWYSPNFEGTCYFKVRL